MDAQVPSVRNLVGTPKGRLTKLEESFRTLTRAEFVDGGTIGPAK